MDARGKQLMREWWTLKLAKEADEAELASMFTNEQICPCLILVYLRKPLAKTVHSIDCSFSFALIIPLAHQDFQQYQNTFALQ
jgi:hypothetical protein